MSPRKCSSKQELEQLGAGNDIGDCCMTGEPIDCTGIPLGEIQSLFEEARRF
jgi:hypothetical protein